MNDLRQQLQSLRIPAAGKESKHFIPLKQLSSILTLDTIKSALQTEKLEPWQELSRIATKVHKTARRTFAILVILRLRGIEILRFLENDHLQTSAIDHRLPYSREDLEKYVPEFAQEFFEKQWEVCAPVLFRDTDHHLLHERTIMPFLEDRKIGRGGFGKVFKIIVHAEHFGGSTRHEVFVRKQFGKIEDPKDKEHERELHNLCLLNQLKHPYISKLVCFYTHKKRRNFVFRLAEGGDLGKLLANPIRPQEFESDFSFFAALCHLSSAIEKLHTFTLEKDVDLNFVGLHRDLKPENILVHDSNFILADFGLSHLNLNEQSSRTPFSGGGADYLAPECEDPKQGFKKGNIGRASDIWSLGCVFLEILVYMKFDSERVAEFRGRRRFTFRGCTMYSFYSVGPMLNEEVSTMIDTLESTTTQAMASFLFLIRQMLKMKEEERPKAGSITSFLSIVAVSERLGSIDRSYKAMIEANTSSQANLEYQRFQTWKYVLGLPVPDSENWNMKVEGTMRLLGESQSTLDFDTTIESLDQTESQLYSILAINEAASYPLFNKLQEVNDRLWKSLPQSLHTSAWIRLEHILLDHSSYNSEDMATQDSFRDLIPEYPCLDRNRISNALFLRHMIRKVNAAQSNLREERITQGKTDLTVNSSTIVDYDTLSDNTDDNMFESSRAVLTDGTHIFVEWIKYGQHWEGNIMDEMIRRVGNIAVFLHETSGKSRLPRLLPCRGFFHAAARNGFGLVFETPASIAGQSPLSLKQMMENSTRSVAVSASILPDLCQRFQLALTLAESILELHLATFLHKGISSMNIVFGINETDQYSIKNPYLIGFNYVRPNDPKAFTEGPPPGKLRRFYQHPDYSIDHTRQGKRFNLAYDYYSLGLVLLEIGLWDNVVTNTKANSALQLRDKLLKRRVPFLGFRTGIKYQDVVIRCLEGRIGRDGDDDATMVEKFEVLVVQPLRDLKV